MSTRRSKIQAVADHFSSYTLPQHAPLLRLFAILAFLARLRSPRFLVLSASFRIIQRLEECRLWIWWVELLGGYDEAEG